MIVTSNLRRAIETGTIAFQNRISETGEGVGILSCLQEISRNFDANALAEVGKIPDMHVILKNLSVKEFDPEKTFTTKENYGNKTLQSTGLIRMEEFCTWAMTREQSQTIIVASGHSLWFRNFFRAFLPANVDHIGKNKKMLNCAIVSFDLVQTENDKFMVDPESMDVIFKGFEGPKLKSV